MRRSGEEENGDESILGSGEFVDRLLAEAEETSKAVPHPTLYNFNVLRYSASL